MPVEGCFLPLLTSQATHPSPRALAGAPRPPRPPPSPQRQECWRQAMLGRPVLTGEIVVHLVTFGFFPGVLASFSPHAQGPIAGLGRELSQRRLWGKIEESEVMSGQQARLPGGTGLRGIKSVLGSCHGEPGPKVKTVLTQTWGGNIWVFWEAPHTLCWRRGQSLAGPQGSPWCKLWP